MFTRFRRAFYQFTALVVLLGFSLTGTASAINKVLTVSPATTKPVVSPGATKTGNFQVLNQGDQDYTVHIYSTPYSVQGEAYTPDFYPVPGKTDASSWLSFDRAEASVKPGQSLNVAYSLHVPTGTQPGGYYAVAFVETHTTPNGQSVVVNERVGEIFYIQVAGPVKIDGKLLGWSSTFLQRQPVSASLRLENDGGVHYASDIRLTVRDVFGHSKYVFATQKELLPQTIRRVPMTWDHSPILGLFKITGTVTTPGKTITLPAKYVLVMSPAVRYVLLGLVGVVVAYTLARRLTRRRHLLKKSLGKS
ncbi:MAG TPA: hypothetical protein VLE99_03645 [Candidatus Saccharimonadales bacterium]|nr:hypothetical protein [Candidatus Saccharimonadales bacterium]